MMSDPPLSFGEWIVVIVGSSMVLAAVFLLIDGVGSR